MKVCHHISSPLYGHCEYSYKVHTILKNKMKCGVRGYHFALYRPIKAREAQVTMNDMMKHTRDTGCHDQKPIDRFGAHRSQIVVICMTLCTQYHLQIVVSRVLTHMFHTHVFSFPMFSWKYWTFLSQHFMLHHCVYTIWIILSTNDFFYKCSNVTLPHICI
jgi:hypothetical protein